MEKIPNRFFKKDDVLNPKYQYYYNILEDIYVNKMKAGSHKLYPEDTNKIYWSRKVEYPWVIMNLEIPYNVDYTIIDLGCGGSPLSHYLAENEDLYVHATDKKLIQNERNSLWGYKVESILELRKKYNRIHWSIENFTESLNIRNNCMDRVYSVSVFEHLTRQELIKAFKEIYRILKKNSLALITVDVSGDHRDNECNYEDIINIAKDRGLNIKGDSDWTIPIKEEMFGQYNVAGMVFTK